MIQQLSPSSASYYRERCTHISPSLNEREIPSVSGIRLRDREFDAFSRAYFTPRLNELLPLVGLGLNP